MDEHLTHVTEFQAASKNQADSDPIDIPDNKLDGTYLQYNHGADAICRLFENIPNPVSP